MTQHIKTSHLVDAERLEIAKLLIKAGYTTRIVVIKENGKNTKIIEYSDG